MDWGPQGFKIRQDETFMVPATSEFSGWKTSYGEGCGRKCSGPCGGQSACSGGACAGADHRCQSGSSLGVVTGLSDLTSNALSEWVSAPTASAFPSVALAKGPRLDAISAIEPRDVWLQVSPTTYGDLWQVPDGWFWGIPVCPCDLSTLKGMEGKGVNVRQDPPSTVAALHHPAYECYRIWRSSDAAGNQCCFDKDGKLITHGSGAGTPDMYNQQFFTHHIAFDVMPFLRLGWEEYHKRGWAPISEDCPKNTGAPGHPAGGFPGRGPSAPNPPRPPSQPSPDEVRRRIRVDCENFCVAKVQDEFTEPTLEARQWLDGCIADCREFWEGMYGL